MYGLTQPSVQISTVLDCPRSIGFAVIDTWLAGALEVDSSGDPALAFTPKTPDESDVIELVWRIMNLTALLLRAVRLPIFCPGKILSIRRQGSDSPSWEILIAMPCVDYTPSELYSLAVQTAKKAVKWVLDRPLTSANREYLFGLLDSDFVQRVDVASMGGESTIAVLRAAWRRGIDFRHLGHGTYQLGGGKNQLCVDRGAIEYDSAIGARISSNKFLSANLLRDAGLPAAIHLQVLSQDAAIVAANRLGWPVVVKPIDRDRGEGVTVNVCSDLQVIAAFQKAKALSRSVLIERQVAGVCHRVLVARGQVRIAAKRLPKSVKGDGSKTVRELIDQANAAENLRPPWLRLKPFPLDTIALACLASIDLRTDSVPAKDSIVPLRPIQTSEWGGVTEDLTDRIHPENASIAIKAARLFGLSVAGIDIISADITRPWYETRAIINEVNFSPLLSGPITGGLISTWLDEWIPNCGRIPIEAVLSGDGDLSLGLHIQSKYASRGISCYLASSDTVVSPRGEFIAMAATGVYERCKALIMDRNVEALILVIQTDELLRTGLPVSRINYIHEQPQSARSKFEALADTPGDLPWIHEMRRLLHAHLSSPETESAQLIEDI